MKKLLTILGVGLILLLAATQVSAQSYNPLIAEIPFSFAAGHEQLPAGKYTISHITRASDQILLLRNEDGRTAEFLHTHHELADKEPKQAYLIFSRYGDLRFLSEMWWPGDKAGHVLAKSDREAALERELRGGRKAKKVTVKAYEE